MTNRWKTMIGAVILVGATTLITTEVISQHHEDDREAHMQQSQKMQDMWQEWMKYAEPGPEHAVLAETAGVWKQRTTHWMIPGADATTSTAVAEFKPILGGRYMLENVRGQHEFEGQVVPFEGVGVFGYDNLRRKHVFVWIDNMSTMIMTGEGTADETGRVITYYSEVPNPMTGGTSMYKSVSRIISDREYVFEMHEKQADGTWFRNMEIVATRR